MEFRYNDHWVAGFRCEKLGRYQYTVRGWTDRFLTWQHDLKKRRDAGQDLSVDFLAPARIDDLLQMVIWVSRLGESSLTLTMELRQDDGRLVATVTLVVVCVSVEGFAKRPLPRIVREALAPFVCTLEEARQNGAVGAPPAPGIH